MSAVVVPDFGGFVSMGRSQPLWGFIGKVGCSAKGLGQACRMLGQPESHAELEPCNEN